MNVAITPIWVPDWRWFAMLAVVVGITWELVDRGDGLGDMTDGLQEPYIIVSPTGSDTPTCGAIETPCLTPQEAASKAVAGDTIYLRNGTYTYTGPHGVQTVVYLSTSLNNGTEQNPITLRNFPAEAPVIDATGVSYGIYLESRQHWDFIGLTITRGDDTCLEFSGSTVGGYSEVRNNNFIECGKDFIDAADPGGHSGIHTNGNQEQIIFDSNYIKSPGRTEEVPDDPAGHQWRHDHSMYLEGRFYTITNNVFVDAKHGWHVRMGGYNNTWFSEVASDVYTHVIINNTFGPNTNPDPDVGGAGHAMVVFTNDPVDPGGAGDKNQYSPRYYFSSNLVLDPSAMRQQDHMLHDTNPALGIYENVTADNVCRYNQVQELANPPASDYCSETDPAVTPNRIVDNNTDDIALSAWNFADAANFDYRIGAGSVADGAGEQSIYTPTFDKDGHPRANPPAVGAYEVSP